ncbi:MAG TPA: cation:proton antiporter family protein [Dehalococcoidia bacterium]|nr:cation:proton antiporter family protein [Dehalococcoidia bacterium]
MEELGLVGSLAVVAIAAVVGGAAARALRLPTIIGYLAAGIVIGPNTPGPSGDIEEVQTVADLGVALLMFTLGVRFSVRELLKVRGIAFVAGVLGTLLLLGVGFVVGQGLGLSTEESVIAGMMTSISSTMVAFKLLEDRGLITGAAGKIAVAVALVQDLIVVVFIAAVPVIGGEGDGLAEEIGLAIVKAAGVLALVLIVGSFVIPRVLERFSRSRSRELFLLAVLALALGTASLSFEAGLSLAFGAFLAGLVVSESPYAQRTIAEVFPLREVFAVVFFVAIGMLVDPEALVDSPEIVAGIALIAIVGKMVTVSFSAVLFRFPTRAVVASSLALANMGEFSFVLATEAGREGLLGDAASEALLSAVLISMAASPLIFATHERVADLVGRLPGIGSLAAGEAHIDEDVRLVNHAVIVRYGPAGKEVARVLDARGFQYVIIDEDPGVLRELQDSGTPYIIGNPSLPSVLEQAAVERARILLLTIRDAALARAVALTARQMNPRLDIVAQGDVPGEAELVNAGVSEVVHGDFEAGMEFVRHTLHRFGLTNQEIQLIINRRRLDARG